MINKIIAFFSNGRRKEPNACDLINDDALADVLDLNETFFHGSPIDSLSTLNINRQNDNPFGHAVYLSKDIDVARCYTGSSNGRVYTVRLNGDPSLAINLDASFAHQHSSSKRAICRTLRHFSIHLNPLSNEDMRGVIHSPYLSHTDKNVINNHLCQHGIWLLYGRLDPMEMSGRMDKGIQYAVIDESFITLCN